MRYFFILWISVCFSFCLSAQTRDTSWTTLQERETEYYKILVPSGWMSLGKLGNVAEQTFDATTFYFADSFNMAPIIAGVFVINQPATDLEDAKEKCLIGYRTNPDRVFPKDFIDGQKEYILSSGQKAYLLNTRFYRSSKKLNQSRYDLVVYSDKAKQGYFITVSVQYKDDTYQFEKDNRLAEFANKVYNFFELK